MTSSPTSVTIDRDSPLWEVAAERARQDAKWGEQNHPLVDPALISRPHKRMVEEYEIPTVLRAIQLCRAAAAKGEVTWAHIAVEELCEFVAAAHHDPAAARAELIQLAAVAVAAVEAIDRWLAANPSLDHSSHSLGWTGTQCPECPPVTPEGGAPDGA